MKTTKECYEKLLEGKSLISVKGETAFLTVDGSLNDLWIFNNPDCWSIKEEKNTYSKYRHWFINHDNILSFVDSEFEDLEIPTVEVIETELIKRIEI